MNLDIEKNRSASKYPQRELALRICWTAAVPLLRLSPRPLHRWRTLVLRLFGATIGRNVHIYPSVCPQFPWRLAVDDHTAIGHSAKLYNLGMLTIGKRVTISQFAHLCGGSHDHSSLTMDLIRAPITIGDDAWICAEAFVGPGVTIGRGAVVGARAVVTRDVAPWTIVAGNPAQEIGKRSLREPAEGQT